MDFITIDSTENKIMNPNILIAKINGKMVQGQAHIQPGVNDWIGVFTVPDNLLGSNPETWKTLTVEYEGPFNCRKECINGKGKARIIYTRPSKIKGKLIVNLQGIEKPQLEKDLEQNLRFSYNENLPVYETDNQRRRRIKNH